MQGTLQQNAKMKIVIAETIPQRIKRLTGIDVIKCPFCKKGKMVARDEIPRTRSPSIVYNAVKRKLKA
jgi:hypothetical protein